MSFDYNPHKHMEFVITDDNKAQWYCHSCGGGWRSDAIPLAAPIEFLILNYKDHLLKSHKLTPEDVKDWSIF